MQVEPASILDTTFASLADPTRRSIVTRLAGGETSLAQLAEPFDMSQTAVSKHVRVLSEAGLVTVEKRGRTRYCRLQASALREAYDWLSFYESFWNAQLDNLAKHLQQSAREKSP